MRSAHAHLAPATFLSMIDRLPTGQVTAWLKANPDVVLGESAWQLLDEQHRTRKDTGLEDALVAMTHVPAGGLDRLCRVRRAVAARVVAQRQDLTPEHLRELLTRDDAEVTRHVWNNPACTDQLRRLVLTGRTMNPRARTDKLTEVPPGLLRDLPVRFCDDALASDNPFVVCAARARRDDAHTRLAHDRALLRAVGTHLRESSPYRRNQLVNVLDRLRTDALSRLRDSEELHERLTADRKTGPRLPWNRGGGRYHPRWLAFSTGVLPDAVAALAALAERKQAELGEPARVDEHRRSELREILRTGDGAIDLDELEDLCGLGLDQIDARLLRDLVGSRDDLFGVDQLVELCEARGHSLPVSALQRIGEAGRRVAPDRLSNLHQIPVEVLVHTIAPAPRVIAEVAGESATRIGALISDTLGDDEQLVATYLTLLDDFDGTVAELLQTVVVLATGQALDVRAEEPLAAEAA